MREIMDIFEATDGQMEEVMELCSNVENTSQKINRSRPKSVASGLIYYWICSKGDETSHISLGEFAGKVGLSDLTVSNIADEINCIISRMNPSLPEVTVRKGSTGSPSKKKQ